MSEQNTKDQKTEERSVDGRAVGHQTKKSRFYAVMRSIFARIMLGLFRVEIVDAENEPQDSGGFIVCSNHISAADPILIVASLRNQVHFVAKAELFHVPLLGLIIRAFGAYPIKRGAADVGAIKRTVELLRGGENVGYFAQGTRLPGELPRPETARPGVGMVQVKTGADVLPVALVNREMKIKPFRRTRLVIGKPIKGEELEALIAERERENGAPLGDRDRFKIVTERVFGEVCAIAKRERG